MRFASLVILAAACGGSSKPPEPQQPAPKPAERRPSPNLDAAPSAKVLGDASLVREAPPPPPPKPTPPAPPVTPIYDRLMDSDGAVPGLTGFSTKRVRDPRRCGGFSILTKRAKKVAPSDGKIVAVFAVEFPTGLDFSEQKKAGSLLKFNTWTEMLTKIARDARVHYEAEYANTDPAVKAAASGRLAQLYLRNASTIARAEIPTDIRGLDNADEATTVYCEQLAGTAEPLLALGVQALEACRKQTLVAPVGWWAELCKATSP